MRLLHSETLQFEDFFERDVPKYAILSHRWGDKEVSFQEMEQSGAPDGPGIEKIRACCRQARQDGLEWVWVDTCCIDKKSSAELSEAINSMFNWYKRAKICYVYLSDVTSRDKDESLRQFKSSQWFTRGWTLQELLAPRFSVFFNARWESIGNETELLPCLVEITKIDATFLRRGDVKRALKERSVAQRMSWAANRVTTRTEDEAYCLLGLFDINMPLLYGEGIRAFRRLQLEIIKESSDESIFAWGLETGQSDPITNLNSYLNFQSVLAASPHDFAKCQTIQPPRGPSRTFSVTNLGLKIRAPLQFPGLDRSFWGPGLNFELNCFAYDPEEALFFPIWLYLGRETPKSYGDQNVVWRRCDCHLSTGLTFEQYERKDESEKANGTKFYLYIKP